jgi:hypothetical protein
MWIGPDFDGILPELKANSNWVLREDSSPPNDPKSGCSAIRDSGFRRNAASEVDVDPKKQAAGQDLIIKFALPIAEAIMQAKDA